MWVRFPPRVVCFLALLANCVLCLCAEAQSRPATQTQAVLPYIAVFIDQATENQLGKVPLDRAVLADAIRKISAQGARAIIVKFFLDQPKTAEGDVELARAMASAKARIILQAHIDDTQSKTNPLPERFRLKADWSEMPGVISGKSGWIPLTEFAASASAIGFADVRNFESAPLIEKYDGSYVKSLFASALEAGFNDTAEIRPGQTVSIAGHLLRLNENSEIAVETDTMRTIPSVSFLDVASGQVAVDLLRNKVVILGYDGAASPTVKTRFGDVKVHPWFCHVLVCCFEKIAGAPTR